MYNETGPEFTPFANPAMMLWAGVFTVMFCACGSMLAMTWRAPS